MPNLNNNGFVEYCVKHLSVDIGARPAGSRANRAAAAFIAREMQQAGYEVTSQQYPCPNWQASSGKLVVAGKKIPCAVNTYSPPCAVEAELVPISSAGDLEQVDVENKVVVLHGDITGSSFLAKNFDRNIYAVESQDRLIELLENKKPLAIIAVSHYEGPIPVILEDSELNIPSVTIGAQDGLYVLQKVGVPARLEIVSERRKGSGANIIGQRRGQSDKKVLISAHYDTKPGTPGALDNASGIAALLLLARRLGETDTGLSLELVAYGGEDSWFPGDALYTREYPPENVAVAINIDGIGLKNRRIAVATFNCSEQLTAQILDAAERRGNFVPEQWYAGDHGFFWPLGIPTLAFTTADGMDLLGTIVHTEHDVQQIVGDRIIEQTVDLVLETIPMFNARQDK